MQKHVKYFNALLEVSKDGLTNIKTLVIFQEIIDIDLFLMNLIKNSLKIKKFNHQYNFQL